jgi:hypothetical protein
LKRRLREGRDGRRRRDISRFVGQLTSQGILPALLGDLVATLSYASDRLEELELRDVVPVVS